MTAVTEQDSSGEAPRSEQHEGGSTEEAAIIRTVLDYFEGWFEGNVSRMDRALHPALVKRSMDRDAAGTDTVESITTQQMIQWTAQGIGKTRDVGDRGIEVRVDDVDGRIASVTVHSTVYTEYVHLVRTGEGWKIVNTLWKPTSIRHPASNDPPAKS